jgi:hypothetical protein
MRDTQPYGCDDQVNLTELGAKTSCAAWKVTSGCTEIPTLAMAGPSRSAPKALKAASLSQASML